MRTEQIELAFKTNLKNVTFKPTNLDVSQRRSGSTRIAIQSLSVEWADIVDRDGSPESVAPSTDKGVVRLEAVARYDGV
jgi:hypothetical protein